MSGSSDAPNQSNPLSSEPQGEQINSQTEGKTEIGKDEGRAQKRDSGRDRYKRIASKLVVTSPKIEFWLATGTWALALLAYCALNDAREANQRGLRAYVSVSAARVIEFVQGKNPKARIAVHNFGQTPAYKLHTTVNFIPIGPAEAAPEIVWIESAPVMTLSPTDAHYVYVTNDTVLDEKLIVSIKNSTLVFIVLAEIRYEDVFGESHFTRYRSYFDSQSIVADDGSVTLAPEGNDSN